MNCLELKELEERKRAIIASTKKEEDARDEKAKALKKSVQYAVGCNNLFFQVEIVHPDRQSWRSTVNDGI